MTEAEDRFEKACKEAGIYDAVDAERLLRIADATGKSAIERLRTVLALLMEWNSSIEERRIGINQLTEYVMRANQPETVRRQRATSMRTALAKLFADAAEEFMQAGDQDAESMCRGEAERLYPKTPASSTH